MLVPSSSWLTSLLFIALATVRATSLTSIYPPADLKRRSLSTGTAVSLPSTVTPPYPTGSANGTAAPTPSAFYLVIADTGTPFDGEYLAVATLPDDNSITAAIPVSSEYRSVFSLSADGTLLEEGTGLVASYYSGYPGGFTWSNPALEGGDFTAATCDIVGGALTCTFGETGGFFVIPGEVIDYEPFPAQVGFGPTVPAGDYPSTILVVPT